MPEIKERPIPFSGPMVRAILDDRKTVTRRAVKKPPVDGWAFDGEYGRITSQHPRRGRFGAFIRRGIGTDFPEMDVIPCPYGMPGDRLWVRETHSFVPDPEEPAGCSAVLYAASDEGPYKKWRPSIHMPRWASRILLEVTDVRVERLQDITAEQAVAEGCFFTDYGRDCFHNGGRIGDVGGCQAPESSHPRRNGWMWDKTNSHEECLLTARFAFANLWQKTGGDWDANPWVWCVEFKRIQP